MILSTTYRTRTIVRITSFAIAILAVLSIFGFTNWKRAQAAERKLEYQYLKSIDDLGNYLDNIQNALTKTMYAGTEQTMTNLTSKLWRESGFAKECLAALPISTLNLEATYKYLSQLGDYAVSLSKKMSSGGTITEEERQNLVQMKEYASEFLQQVLITQDAIRTGSISFQEVSDDAKGVVAATNTNSHFSDGFAEFEEGFTSYPTLIYDGPFSDHILQKEPEMIKNLPEISKEEARQYAAKACGLSAEQLQDDTDEEGNMPSYCFTGENINLAVTKKGGLLSYYIKNRTVETQEKSAEECIYIAESYLETLGIPTMKYTYYEIDNNVITVNFAHVEGDVTCYTDLAKVSVAMDNAEIVRYDARGYITNHLTRTDLIPKISREEAQQSLSPMLNVKQVQTVLIPSEGLNEVLTYEFDCYSEQDEHVLVYINAETGQEQQILILYTDENGTLTL